MAAAYCWACSGVIDGKRRSTVPSELQITYLEGKGWGEGNAAREKWAPGLRQGVQTAYPMTPGFILMRSRVSSTSDCDGKRGAERLEPV